MFALNQLRLEKIRPDDTVGISDTYLILPSRKNIFLCVCNVEQLEVQIKIIISFACYYLIVVSTYSPNWFKSVLVLQKKRDQPGLGIGMERGKEISETLFPGCCFV